MYSYEEVYKATLGYFQEDELATDVVISKYLLKDKEGNFLELSPIDMHKRHAKELARIEQKYPNPLPEQEIYDLLYGFNKFILAGSPMYGIGNPYSITSISNCYGIGNEYDSIAGINEIGYHASEITKRRGGTGFDISHLRPKNSLVKNSSNSSTGGVSFIRDIITRVQILAQQGRRGSTMVTCSSEYPDIDDFIRYKVDNPDLYGCNISIRASDSFMEQGIKDKNLVFKDIAKQVWNSGDPGLLFWDRITSESPADCYPGYETKTTNPCAELPLCFYGSCILGSINLYSYVVSPFDRNATIDLYALRQDVKKMTRLMDDLVDLELEKIDLILGKIYSDPEPVSYKLPELALWNKIKKVLEDTRRVGFGITALADTFAALNLPYADVYLSSAVMEVIRDSFYETTVTLAKERGTFPIFDLEFEKDNPFLNRVITSINKEDVFFRRTYKKYGRRNISCLTVAPTGSISLLTRTSSGVEPIFAPYYTRRRKVNKPTSTSYTDEYGIHWEKYNIVHPGLKKWADITFTTGKNDLQNAPEEILLDYYEQSPYYLQTAHDIDPKKKLKMIGTMQFYIDHSISHTLNMPNNASVDDIVDIILYAYRVGCKGISIFRDGCKEGIFNAKNSKDAFIQHDSPKRPKELPCDIFTVVANKIKWSVVVGLMEDKPFEIFALPYRDFSKQTKGMCKKVKSGVYHVLLPNGDIVENIVEEIDENQAAITRLASGWLRTGGKVLYVAETMAKKGALTSFNKALGRVLKTYVKNETKSKELCPECSEKLIYQEGCLRCTCGYNKCG